MKRQALSVSYEGLKGRTHADNDWLAKWGMYALYGLVFGPRCRGALTCTVGMNRKQFDNTDKNSVWTRPTIAA